MTPSDEERREAPDGGEDREFPDRPDHPSTDEAAQHGIETYRKADEDGDPAAAYNLGVVLQSKGQDDEAEEAFRRADERGHPVAPYALGEVLAERGDEDGAKEAFERSAERGYERAQLRLGKPSGPPDDDLWRDDSA